MDRTELVLAALSCADGGLHTPVQLQKLLFLIDKNIPESVGGPHFSFRPYDYGPFDKDVYYELEILERQGYAESVKQKSWSSYRLTSDGQDKGTELLQSLPEATSNYIHELSDFVRSLTFTQLVSTIYKAYPEMKVNSVFRESL